jgi:hypothetical protein
VIVVVKCKIGDGNNCPPLSHVDRRTFLCVQPKTSICNVEICANPGALHVQRYCEASRMVLVKVDIGAVIR